ncbi:MAG: protein kinase [Clostridiales bacterium]|nr:protein kinase [Clostridiales bacterium]
MEYGEINGYQLKSAFMTENAGNCKWAFAQKNGYDYFVKEFLSPKYPLDESLFGPELTRQKRESAELFFYQKERFYQCLKKCRTGNNVVVLDFFRNGTKYYAVSEQVKGSFLTIQEIAALSEDAKYTLIRAILYSISALHKMRIVHSDLRPDNILVIPTAEGYCTAKIIDFDDGFWEAEPPKELRGSQNYFSPEAVRRIQGGTVSVTTKSDIWALGLLFHQYWTGKMPGFSDEYHYAAEAVLNFSPLAISDSIPDRLRYILAAMLLAEPDSRPTAEEALKALSARDQRETGWRVPSDLD